MAEIEYSYKPQGSTLEQYLLSREQRTIITGPLGSAKTNTSCWKAFRIMLDQEPDSDGVRRTRGLAVRNTYPDLFGTTVKDWLEMFGDLGNFNKGGMEPPTHRLKFKLDDGTTVDAELIFLALDREDHVKKLRGMQLTFAWLNEVKELMFTILEMVDLRIGRYPMNPTWYGMFGDTNAPDTDHWLYRLSEELKPEGWLFLKQPGGLIRKSADSPWELNPKAENLHNLPLGYYTKGAQGKTESWIKVNLANEYGFVADGKPVWPDYRDSVHCKSFDLVKGLPVHIGLDFGLTPAAIFAQRMVNGQWRWRHELVTTDTGVIRFANELVKFIKENLTDFTIGRITGDPSGDQRQVGDKNESTVFQLLEANGVKAEPAHTNDFAIRSEAVANPLRRMIDGEPGFLIHPEMKVTRKGMQGAYKFRRLQLSGEDRYRDVPEKNSFSHSCFVAGTLISVGSEMIPIEALRAGDMVSTPIGMRLVVANMRRSVDSLVDVEISTGVTLRCTPDHPFAKPEGGFIPAEALQYMDLLVSEGNPWAGLQNTQFKSSRESATTTSQAVTSRPTTSTAVNICTERFGKIVMAIFHLGTTCTTAMRSKLIAVSKTLNSFPAPCINECTVTSKTKQRSGGYWIKQGRLPLLRTAQWLALMPQQIAAGEECNHGHWSNAHAFSADANTRPRPGQFDADSVAPTANRPRAALQAWTTRFATALCAALSSRLTGIKSPASAARVVQVRTAGKGVVYNLEVEEAHCYYAGGVLVSNCEAGQYLMLGGGEGVAAIQTVSTPETEAAAASYREARGLGGGSSSSAFRRRRGM